MKPGIWLCAGVAVFLSGCGQTEQAQSPEPLPQILRQKIAEFDREKMDTANLIEWVDTQIGEGAQVEFKDPIDDAASDFVFFALQLGQLDADYVDAYHGPMAWKDIATSQKPDAEILATQIGLLRERLSSLETSPGSQQAVRVANLQKFTRAMALRLKVINGEAVSFNTEVTDIYDEQIPVYDLAEYDAVLAKIDALLPLSLIHI